MSSHNILAGKRNILHRFKNLFPSDYEIRMNVFMHNSPNLALLLNGLGFPSKT